MDHLPTFSPNMKWPRSICQWLSSIVRERLAYKIREGKKTCSAEKTMAEEELSTWYTRTRRAVMKIRVGMAERNLDDMRVYQNVDKGVLEKNSDPSG